MRRIGKLFIPPLLLLSCICLAALIALHTIYQAKITTPNNQSQTTIVTVSSGETVQQITDILAQQHLISDKTLFDFYLKLSRMDTSIEAGVYTVPPHISIVDIVKLFQKGNASIKITIPEGERLEQQASTIDQQLSVNNPEKQFNADDFISLAKNPALFASQFPFVSGHTSLEGFLFPDTYFVQKDINAQEVINLMLNDFKQQLYDIYAPTSSNESFYNNLILASMLVREAKTATDQAMVADILLRRLQLNIPLGVDATVEYMLGYSNTENTWWRQTIYQSQLDENNPYNTRLNPGLPPTPICSPGVASMEAAYKPIHNSYFYYISDSDGNIHYATTAQEQEANIQKYLR